MRAVHSHSNRYRVFSDPGFCTPISAKTHPIPATLPSILCKRDLQSQTELDNKRQRNRKRIIKYILGNFDFFRKLFFNIFFYENVSKHNIFVKKNSKKYFSKKIKNFKCVFYNSLSIALSLVV